MLKAIFQTTLVHELIGDDRFLIEFASLNDGLPSWLVFAFFLYLIGLAGMVFNYKNFLVTMMSVEMMYLGASSSFILYGAICHDPRGFIYGLLFLILAACESAIGLGILIVLYRFGGTIDFKAYQQLGG